MNMKTMLCVAVSALSSAVVASGTPEVSNVVMVQSDSSRKVTITYNLSNAPDGAVVTLDIETNKTGSATNVDSDWVSIGGAAVCNAQGDVWKKVSQGSKTITWRPDLSWEGHKVELANGGARAVVTAWALDNTPDYMVVDITSTGGMDTQRYYPAADFVPRGVTSDLYKTGSLLMRKIMAKDVTWMMGSVTEAQTWISWEADREVAHQVTLTNNYYIGVYPVTQTQWQEVTGYNPSHFSAERWTRPVEKVSYTDIRQGAGTASAAASATAGVFPNEPYGGSFLGLLRDKTKIDFDLPSDAQWEFAARAGNGEGHWGNGSTMQIVNNRDANLNLYGRYLYNPSTNSTSVDAAITPSEGGTAIVGSYVSNDWGLYDMGGNVYEWCLDWFAKDIAELNGAVNTTAGTSRAQRSGGWASGAVNCRPAYRNSATPTDRTNARGFRVVCTAGLQ